MSDDPIPETIQGSGPVSSARERGGDVRGGGERSELQPAPAWSTGWTEPAAIVVEQVCRILGAVRGRVVRPIEAGTDSVLVAQVLELEVERPLAVLAEEVELVARWAEQAPDGRDDLGGVRPDGFRWGSDRRRRVGSVLAVDRWFDRLDAARRWASGAAPPGKRGWEDPRRRLTPEEEAEGREALEWLKARGMAS